jgi:hypothetical protein
MDLKLKFLILICSIIVVGCEIDGNNNESTNDNDTKSPYAWYPGKVDPNQIPPSNTTVNNTGSGDQNFLWKPEGENSKKLVILIPAKLSTDPIGTLTIHDSIRGKFSSVANGNRAHYRFDKPGSAYGKDIPVVLIKNGKKYEWIVPNGGTRYTKKF